MDGPQPILVMEYCGGGSLDKLLFVSNQPLSEQEKINFVRGIASGMLHLHNHNIIHRDLAARNILISESGQPKISVSHFSSIFVFSLLLILFSRCDMIHSSLYCDFGLGLWNVKSVTTRY
jgi:serine/threonine protein kinase